MVSSGGNANSSSALVDLGECKNKKQTNQPHINQPIYFMCDYINIKQKNNLNLLMLFIPHVFKLIQVNWYFILSK